MSALVVSESVFNTDVDAIEALGKSSPVFAAVSPKVMFVKNK